MFLGGAAIHIILVTVGPGSFDSFARGSWWPFIADAWRSVLVPGVYYLISLLVVFEAVEGLLILSRAYRRIGIGAAIAFNAALILFGWGFACGAFRSSPSCCASGTSNQRPAIEPARSQLGTRRMMPHDGKVIARARTWPARST
jgi:hypothetical protein